MRDGTTVYRAEDQSPKPKRHCGETVSRSSDNAVHLNTGQASAIFSEWNRDSTRHRRDTSPSQSSTTKDLFSSPSVQLDISEDCIMESQ